MHNSNIFFSKIVNYIEEITDPLLMMSFKEIGVKINVTQNNFTYKIEILCGFPCDLLREHWQTLLIQKLLIQFYELKFEIIINQFIKAHATQLLGKGLRGVKNIIAIASGKGGVGKSTMTVNLAHILAKSGARVGILDADIYGPSIPMMLGATNTQVSIQDDKYLPIYAHEIQTMSIGYLTNNDEQALIWRGPMLAKALLQMLDITLWAELDYLFIDLPPGTGDIQLSLVQKIPLTAAIIVTTPQSIATLDAQKAINLFNKTNINILGLIENMAMHQCNNCGHQEAIFGEFGGEKLCYDTSIQFLGKIPLDTEIRKYADNGLIKNHTLNSPWYLTALRAAILLAHLSINYANKFPPIIVE